MSNGRLANARFRVEDLHAQSVFRVASDVAFYASLVFHDVSPDKCIIGAVSRLMEELFAQNRFGFRRLRHDEQAACVLVDAVHQSYFRVIGIE